MNYYELTFTTVNFEEYQHDLLIGELGEVGFDTFEDTDTGFKAYIPEDDFNKILLDEVLIAYRELLKFNYEIELIEGKNWNEVWESNFEPIAIIDQVFVRATFHEPRPEFKYEIV